MRFVQRLAGLAVLGVGVAFVGGHVGEWRSIILGGVDTMVGRTAIETGQDMKREILQGTLERAAAAYRATEGSEPADLEALVEAGLLQGAALRDEWGRRLAVEQRAGRLVVRGLGRDNRPGTADDWTLVL